MVHASGTDGMLIPTMASDNVVMYLLEHADIAEVVLGVQSCVDAVGGFSRRGPRLMKRMGGLGEPGEFIYGAADDYYSVVSLGQRIGSIFGQAYERMMTLDF